MTVKSLRLVSGLVGALLCVGFAVAASDAEADRVAQGDEISRLQVACLLDLDQQQEVSVKGCLERQADTGSHAARFVLGLNHLLGRGGDRLRGMVMLQQLATEPSLVPETDATWSVTP